MAEHSLAAADDLLNLALVNVCMAAAAGEDEVVLRNLERIVQ